MLIFIESREKAYVHAITSAGIAYAITKACSRGELNECSCDSKIQKKNAKKNWQWGGCSEVWLDSSHILNSYNIQLSTSYCITYIKYIQ